MARIYTYKPLSDPVTSMLYLSWAEMGMTGAPSATVPSMNFKICSCCSRAWTFVFRFYWGVQFPPPPHTHIGHFVSVIRRYNTSAIPKIWIYSYFIKINIFPKICMKLISQLSKSNNNKLHYYHNMRSLLTCASFIKSILFWRIRMCFNFMISIAAKCSKIVAICTKQNLTFFVIFRLSRIDSKAVYKKKRVKHFRWISVFHIFR